MRLINRGALLCFLLTACSRPDDSKPVGAAPYPHPTTRMKPARGPVIDADTVVYARKDMQNYPQEDYPAPAQESEIEGSVGLACQIAADQGLDRCVVLSETPPGYEFGRAAAILMMRTRHADMSHNPAGSWVHITARFQLDKH